MRKAFIFNFVAISTKLKCAFGENVERGYK